MYCWIEHKITDTDKFWGEAGKMMDQIPDGLKLISALPSSDGKNAVCLWETKTTDGLKDYMEGHVGNFANNHYFEVNQEKAMGLPTALAATGT